MTLSDAQRIQDQIREKLVREKEAGEQPATEPAAHAAESISLRQWQESDQTSEFLLKLCDEIKKLDEQAKNLAMLDNGSSSSAIRALLIESATLRKVISYARRNDTNTAY